MLFLCVAFLTARFAYGQVPPSSAPTLPVPALPVKQVSSGSTVYLRGWTGKYLDVEGTEVQCRWNHRGAWQAFIIEKGRGSDVISSGDTIYLRAHTGKHIDVEGEEVQSRWDSQGGWQKLTIENADGPGLIASGDAIYLKAHTGKYVDIEGAAVNAGRAQRGWQKLTIEVYDNEFQNDGADRLNGVAQQSSTFNGEGPENALDGNMKSRAHTVGNTGETNPWWQLDVGKSTSIGQIRLLNRPDRCASRLFTGYRCRWEFSGRKFGGGWEGADISVSDMTCSGDTCPQRKICTRLTQPSSGDHWYDVSCDGAIGRYVSVVLPGKNRVLNFMEIEIYPAHATQQLLLYESFEYPAVQGGTPISQDGLHLILNGWTYLIHTDQLQIATESHDSFTTPHGNQALKVFSYMGSNHGGAITTADALNATLQPNTKYTLTANVAKLAPKPYGDYLVELGVVDDDTQKWITVAATWGLAEKSDMSESLKIEVVSTSSTIEEKKPVVRIVQFANDALSLPVGARLAVRLRKNDVSDQSNIPLYDNVRLVARQADAVAPGEADTGSLQVDGGARRLSPAAVGATLLV